MRVQEDPSVVAWISVEPLQEGCEIIAISVRGIVGGSNADGSAVARDVLVTMTSKIEALVAGAPTPFEYGNTFGPEGVGGRDRLVIGFDQAQDGCLRALAAELAGSFQLLYVLHTSRTGAALARYESPELTIHDVHQFMHRFGRFLVEDARHDLWLRSHDDDGTIVLDRHNVIYAYGPIERFEAVLLNIGLHRSGLPRVPDPHVHHFHSEWDDSERKVLKALPWIRKPLRDVDVQNSGASAG